MTSTPAKPAPTRAERALWTFLMCTLVAPFLAAVIIFLSSIVAGAIGRGPASLLALDSAGQLAWAAEKAVSTYVWSALPAGVGGLALAALVYTKGAAPWLMGATAGAVTVSVFAALSGGMVAQHLAPIAFIGALAGTAMCLILKRARIAT